MYGQSGLQHRKHWALRIRICILLPFHIAYTPLSRCATHRILYEFLQNKDITYDAETIEMLCKQSNYKEKMATTAERDSIKYKQAEFLTTQIGKQFKGVISGVTSFGIFVEMIENKCEGKVSIRNMNEPFNFDEKNLVLTGKYSGTQYTLGQEVMVTIANANAEKMEIDLTINEL